VGAPLFVVHVTCAAAAAEIDEAQKRGAPVTGETCTQYLVNDIGDLERPGVEGCRYVCSPPLRDASNHGPLWVYLKRGVLESGLDNFSLVPNGLAVIQHRLPMLWDEGVNKGRLTRPELVARTSTTIAQRFGLDRKGALMPGKDADLVVLDPNAPRDYGLANSFMNVDYDLYEGRTASTSVRHTYSRGTLVYDRGQIVTEPGHGRFVERSLKPQTAVSR
jgi:dihydropyrimidinase